MARAQRSHLAVTALRVLVVGLILWGLLAYLILPRLWYHREHEPGLAEAPAVTRMRAGALSRPKRCAYQVLMAERSGFQALYLSGAGVANASYGLPDLGMTSLNDVLIDAERITAATRVPLLVDIDTGWGGAFNIGKYFI